VNGVTLDLTQQEFEYLMNVLGQRPFLEVQGLIQKLVQQANNQRTSGPIPGPTE
jgi:hypothetical protein